MRRIHLWISLGVGTAVWGAYFAHVVQVFRADDLSGLFWWFAAALVAAVALEAAATAMIARLFRLKMQTLDDGPSLSAALQAGHVALMFLVAQLLILAAALALASRLGWSFDLATTRMQAFAANLLLGMVVMAEGVRAGFTLALLPRR